MFRDLQVVANATPKDYLLHVPRDPTKLALQMETKAKMMWPQRSEVGAVIETNYSFLYIGPGAGLVVQTLLDRGHRAFALETSRRGIAFAPEVVRNYVLWSKPWELPFPSRQGETSNPFKMFHIGILHKYYKEILNRDEWNESIKELKKVCRYSALIGDI